MASPPPDADTPAPAFKSCTPADALAALRELGAHRSDPIGFRRLEVLAQRAAQHSGGALGDALTRRFREVLAGYRDQLVRARAQADALIGSLRERLPSAVPQLDALQARNEHRALARLAKRLQADADRDAALAPLRALCRSLGQHGVGTAASGAPLPPAEAGSAAPHDLKVLRDSRATWSRLAVDRQLSRSLQKTPGNPGPLNSHALVLRALQQMDAIAPAYLDRFVTHVETLLWLDRATSGAIAPADAARPPKRPETTPPRPAGKRPRTKR